jgi:hypothetical protein
MTILHSYQMPNQHNDLREQLREAKLGYLKLAGEVQRLAWERDEAVRKLQALESQPVATISEYSRAKAIRQVRAFIEREGRTPTAREMGARGGPKRPDLPWSSSISQWFGGLPQFWAMLGVETRKRGHHLRRSA